MGHVGAHAFTLKHFLYYWLRATNKYSLQAPFIYQFYNEVIGLRSACFDFDSIEILRKELKKDSRTIEVLDLGAGSKVLKGTKRKISSIARTSLSSPKFSQFLFRLIRHINPNKTIELGTSLGINTLYLAKAKPSMQIFTLEGCPAIGEIAAQNFRRQGCENITLLQGNIDKTLAIALQKSDTVDLVYFDANHTQEATLRYFNLCLEKINPRSVFVFDDIHLSPEMNEAWKNITENPKVTMSIDIFDAGLIFFEGGLQKKNYILEF